MAANTGLIPKQWKLNTSETQNSFENWKESICWHVSLDTKSSRFLTDLKTWNNTPNRGFTDDPESFAPAEAKMTAIAKKTLLSIILGSVASNAPVISPKFIKNVATSLDDIWSRLRQFYGFKKSGSRITEFLNFKLEVSESREQLWERMYTFLEDNLLVEGGEIKHEGVAPTKDEELSPTLLCILVVNWLHTIHPSLPNAVKQRFTIQLRTDTIYSIREEISDSIPTILEEIEDRAGISRLSRFAESKYNNRAASPKFSKPFKPVKKRCCLCEAKNRPAEGHFLSQCPFLPSEDKRYMSKTREITLESDNDTDCDESSDANVSRLTCDICLVPCPIIRKVDIMSSPVVKVSSKGIDASMILDLGAEANLATSDLCKQIGARIRPTKFRAFMADGITPLPTEGEANFTINLGHHSLNFSGLVVKSLDKPIIAGIPFLTIHDIYARPSLHTVYIGDCCSFQYNDKSINIDSISSINRCSASVLRVSKQTCLLPGESLSLTVPEELSKEKILAVEPRRDTSPNSTPEWLSCHLASVVNGSINVPNKSSEPILIGKHSQILQVRRTEVPIDTESSSTPQPIKPPKMDDNAFSSVKVDPSNILSKADKEKFYVLHKQYNSIFSPGIGCYNQYSGPFKHKINISVALPPQRKGRIPFYKPKDMDLLQQKCDELLSEGVLCRPEDRNISVTHCHPSFLVKKPSGGHRLVTDFGNFKDYIYVPPTVSTNVEDVLRKMGQFNYILKTDITKAYFHIQLDTNSMGYVGINTPYKGIYVYTRSVMGLPGSEAALEEVMSRILGDLIQSGSVIKLVDDLYIGAQSVDELLKVWSQVLHRLNLNGMKLSPAKTEICPTSTIILGWLWEKGSISPTSHRLNALSVCDPPSTIKGLRSYIGSYKYMSRSLPSYADILHPLEEACSSHKSGDKLVWTDQLTAAFEKSKKHLKNAESVVLPKYSEQLHIICDAALRCAGIASTMFVVRNNKLYTAGHFNAKRRNHQSSWLPCEIEALCIGVSIKHFSPYILQSNHQTKVMTDSKPCVQAYQKMQRGGFSTSTRVHTFLSIVSRFRVEVIHIPGKNNIFADFASRNTITCGGSCQICTYISDLENSVIGSLHITDILSGKASIPYTSRAAWLQFQQSCPDLTKAKEFIQAGITPSGKKKGISKDTLRYLNCVSLSTSPSDGMLVVKRSVPFVKTSQRIVIPRDIAPGILTALHIELNHPTAYQMEQVFAKAFFMLDMHSAVAKIVSGCHICASLKKVPSNFQKQTTSTTIDKIGISFSTDVIKDNGQLILFIRESISSITAATIIPDEKATSLRDGIIITISGLRSSMSPPAIVRSDPASGFRQLVNDQSLCAMNLRIELGDAKNPNKNPVAESAVQEIRAELIRLQPHGGKVSQSTLSHAILNLNSRVRHNKLSAFEIFTQRDMISCDKLNLDDAELIKDKINHRSEGHLPSAKYKARGKTVEPFCDAQVGDIVYLYVDKSKSRGRDKYIVIEIDKDYAHVQKLTNNQIRARKYRVKLSELITVQATASSKTSQRLDQYKDDIPKSTRVHDSNKTLSDMHIEKSFNTDKVMSDSNCEDSSDEDEGLSFSDILHKIIPPDNSVAPDINIHAINDTPRRVRKSHAVRNRPSRHRRPPSYLDDYVGHGLAVITPLPETFDADL